jgi:O-antigen/teichoic acid export membrane protein
MLMATAVTDKHLRFWLARLIAAREVWALADQALVSGTNFVTNVVLARLAGAHVFGAFALAWTVVLFANMFQDAFIISPMMSLRPKLDEDAQPRYLGALISLELALAGCCTIVVQGGCYLAGQRFHTVELLLIGPSLSAATFCFLVQDFLRRYLFTIHRSSAAFWIDLLSYPPQIVLIAAVAKPHGITAGGAFWIVAVTSAAGICAAALCVGPIHFELTAIGLTAKRHWRISRWLALSVVLAWMSNNLFFVVAPVFFGVAAAGVVRASQNIVGVAHIWFIGLNNVTPVETARVLHRQGVRAAKRYIGRVVLRWGALTSLFIAGVCCFPTLLLHAAYGAQYDRFSNLVRLYGVLYLLLFIGYPIRALLQAIECTAPIFWAYVAMAGFAVAFAAPFGHWFGISGVIIGSIATQLIYLCVLTVLLRACITRYRPQQHSIVDTPNVTSHMLCP